MPSLKTNIKRHKLLWGLLAILLSFIILVLLLFAIAMIRAGDLSTYPNSVRTSKNCGGQSTEHLNGSWMFIFTRCYISADSEAKIDEWHKLRGWYPSGERLVFPPVLRLGSIGLEIGKQFITEVRSDGSVLIVQQVIYRFGRLISSH